MLTEANQWLDSRGEGLWVNADLSESSIHESVRDGEYLLARLDGRTVGAARLVDADLECWPDVDCGTALYVHRLAVRRCVAGLGVSSLILDWCEARARMVEKRYLRLDCDVSRAKLIVLYTGLGFAFHSERQVGAYRVVRFQKLLSAEERCS